MELFYFFFAVVQRARAGETRLPIGSDYFTENFQIKENNTKIRNVHPRFFYLLTVYGYFS